MISENSENSEQKFYCKKCDYTCFLKQHYVQHCKTIKHNDKKMVTNYHNNDNNSVDDNKVYICLCGKEYSHASGLSRHKKTCTYKEEEIKDKDELVLSLVKEGITSILNNHLVSTTETNKQNQEFQLQMFSQLIDVIKNSNNNINNGQITNNTNYNQFNLNLYLNETCKNAMTIDEFLDYLQPTIEELEDTARLGYVEGITRIIMRGLKDLEAELRPFHCSDLKRETLFIKNSEGEWEKDSEDKPIMIKFVKEVGRKNFNNVNNWKKNHPNCKSYDSKSNDMFNQIMINSTSGSTENYEKVIKNIAKEVVINKSKKNTK